MLHMVALIERRSRRHIIYYVNIFERIQTKINVVGTRDFGIYAKVLKYDRY